MGDAAVTDAERIVRHIVVVSASLTLWRLALRNCDVHQVLLAGVIEWSREEAQ